MKKVILSTINYNRSDLTNDCLRSLNHLNQDGIDLEIVVVDNASKEELSVREEDFPKLKLTVIRQDVNSGFSGGHNTAFAYALKKDADYVVILNNDTTIDPDCIIELIKVGEKHEEAGIIAPKIYFSKGSEYHKERYKNDELGRVLWYAGGLIDWDNAYWHHRGVDEVDHKQYDSEGPTEYASGCCFAIKKETLTKVGGFDEKYFLYYEDSDINERVKRQGYSIFFAPKAFLWHINAGSTGGSGSSLQDYFTTRNRLLVASRYAGSRAKVALLRESSTILRKGRKWQRKGVLDFYLRNFGKGSYPL